jgi:hypothetical protein
MSELADIDFKSAREGLVENFLTRLNAASSVEELGVSIFAMCAAMGLTFDKARREFIQANFVHVPRITGPFKEFKSEIIAKLRAYLRTQIK